jgi:hypothetical protein
MRRVIAISDAETIDHWMANNLNNAEMINPVFATDAPDDRTVAESNLVAAEEFMSEITQENSGRNSNLRRENNQRRANGSTSNRRNSGALDPRPAVAARNDQRRAIVLASERRNGRALDPQPTAVATLRSDSPDEVSAITEEQASGTTEKTTAKSPGRSASRIPVAHRAGRTKKTAAEAAAAQRESQRQTSDEAARLILTRASLSRSTGIQPLVRTGISGTASRNIAAGSSSAAAAVVAAVPSRSASALLPVPVPTSSSTPSPHREG